MAEKLFRRTERGREEIPEEEVKIILAERAEDEKEKTATQYIRDRQSESPSIESLVVALYDTDDKAAIEAKRAAVKLKYPKPS